MKRIKKRLSGGSNAAAMAAAAAQAAAFERTVGELPEMIRNQDWKPIRCMFSSARRNPQQKRILQRYLQECCRKRGDDDDEDDEVVAEEEVGEAAAQEQPPQRPRQPPRRRRSSMSRPSNMLSWACKFHPPLDVIVSLCQLHFHAVGIREDATDALLRRYPIHVACRSGASPTVVAYLARCHPLGVCAQDVHGKTPLHLATEYYGKHYDPLLEKQHVLAASSSSSITKTMKATADPAVLPKTGEVWSSEEAVYRVVSFLCHLKPSAVNLEDNSDRTALELAIELETCPIKAVKKMQKASEKDWKRRREEKKKQMSPSPTSLSTDATTPQSLDAFMKQHVENERNQLEEQLRRLTTQDLANWQKQMLLAAGAGGGDGASDEEKQPNTASSVSTTTAFHSTTSGDRRQHHLFTRSPRKKKSTTRAAHAA